jgi:hypothetical protein
MLIGYSQLRFSDTTAPSLPLAESPSLIFNSSENPMRNCLLTLSQLPAPPAWGG